MYPEFYGFKSDIFHLVRMSFGRSQHSQVIYHFVAPTAAAHYNLIGIQGPLYGRTMCCPSLVLLCTWPELLVCYWNLIVHGWPGVVRPRAYIPTSVHVQMYCCHVILCSVFTSSSLSASCVQLHVYTSVQLSDSWAFSHIWWSFLRGGWHRHQISV